jgi:hypothetical protein
MAEPPGPAAGEIRWDRSAARDQTASLASAVSAQTRIVLSFGVHRGEDVPGAEQSVSLLRQVALQPMTAKHLHDMLARLIAEANASKPTLT